MCTAILLFKVAYLRDLFKFWPRQGSKRKAQNERRGGEKIYKMEDKMSGSQNYYRQRSTKRCLIRPPTFKFTQPKINLLMQKSLLVHKCGIIWDVGFSKKLLIGFSSTRSADPKPCPSPPQPPPPKPAAARTDRTRTPLPTGIPLLETLFSLAPRCG